MDQFPATRLCDFHCSLLQIKDATHVFVQIPLLNLLVKKCVQASRRFRSKPIDFGGFWEQPGSKGSLSQQQDMSGEMGLPDLPAEPGGQSPLGVPLRSPRRQPVGLPWLPPFSTDGVHVHPRTRTHTYTHTRTHTHGHTHAHTHMDTHTHAHTHAANSLPLLPSRGREFIFPPIKRGRAWTLPDVQD